jgi:hypothetical protein
MKKLFLAVVLCMSVFAAQAQDTKKFVKQYAGRAQFTVVCINRAAMNMMTLLAKLGVDGDNRKMLAHVKDMQVLSGDYMSKAQVNALQSDVLAFCAEHNYEQLMEIIDATDVVTVWGCTNGATITGFIICDKSKKGASVELVCINGKFTPEDIPSIVSKTGKSIASVTIN